MKHEGEREKAGEVGKEAARGGKRSGRGPEEEEARCAQARGRTPVFCTPSMHTTHPHLPPPLALRPAQHPESTDPALSLGAAPASKPLTIPLHGHAQPNTSHTFPLPTQQSSEAFLALEIKTKLSGLLCQIHTALQMEPLPDPGSQARLSALEVPGSWLRKSPLPPGSLP